MKNNISIWLIKQSKRYIPVLILLTFLNIVQGYLLIRFALGSKEVIDYATGQVLGDYKEALIKLALIILILILSRTISNLLSQRETAALEITWKKQLYHKIIYGEFAAVSKFHSGDLINRMTSDITAVCRGSVSIVPEIGYVITRLVGAVIALAGIAPYFTLILTICGFMMAAAMVILRRYMKNLHKRLQESNGKVSGFFQETIEKLLMVQSTNVEKEVEQRSGALLRDNWKIQKKQRIISVIAGNGIFFLCYAAEFAALLWCSNQVMKGIMTFGTLTAVIQLVGQLEMPFANIAGFIPQYIAIIGSGERLKEIYDLPPDIYDEIYDVNDLYSRMEGIHVKDLTFAYDNRAVLDRASFFIKKGNLTVITGTSGIGKSTLLKLMLGIYHPDSGTIYLHLDQEDIPLSRNTRKLFAYVPQGNLLLSGTIRDNLVLMRPEVTENEIWNVLEVCELKEVMNALPDKLETRIGENAAGLSEGQAQRVSIARALLSDAPIILLDEATSSLDERTERNLINNIIKLPGKTVIAVTHRPAAVEMADCQIILGEGQTEIKHKR